MYNCLKLTAPYICTLCEYHSEIIFIFNLLPLFPSAALLVFTSMDSA